MRSRLFAVATSAVALGVFSLSAHAVPEISAENLIKQNSAIKYWDVKASGGMRDGTTTQQGVVVDVVRPTKIQDGSLCHNSGTSCYCTPVKYRITPSVENKWHVLVDSANRKVTECPAGVTPTGTADSKALSREEAKARREAIMAEKKAKRNAK